MGMEAVRASLLRLPRVVETLQWGHNLVYWVMDKSVGGKMFAVIDSERVGSHVMAFAAGPERFYELLETEGVRPAPYLARAHWVAIEAWDVFPPAELATQLRAAHALVYAKLPARAKAVYALQDREYRRVVRERRALLRNALPVVKA